MKTNENIDFPIDPAWSTDEIVTVTKLYELVLEANEGGVDREQLLAAYNAFRTVIPAKGEQRQLDRQLSQQTGISIYQTMKQAADSHARRLVIQQ
ncbi:UPF0223 family protein [Furfurilactobacillus sp. WILCCON 0119]|uniref:UPF0223 family protein n=1 Tax=Furfurilactobacillus entadae TaxID=2922307 RepID=UPI0035ED563A